MSNLLASLVSSANTLQAYGQVMETLQNNVSNASTPGYAKQSAELYALPFDPEHGVTGGVRAGELRSTRNEYAEQAVRRQTVALGREQQLVSAWVHATLEDLSQLVDVSAVFEADGSVSVTLQGETPLLLGDRQYPLSSSLYQQTDPPPPYPDAPASVRLTASDGSDVTAKTT